MASKSSPNSDPNHHPNPNPDPNPNPNPNPKPNPKPNPLKDLDLDGDGVVSQDDFLEWSRVHNLEVSPRQPQPQPRP